MQTFSRPQYETRYIGDINTTVHIEDGIAYVTEIADREYDRDIPDYCYPSIVHVEDGDYMEALSLAVHNAGSRTCPCMTDDGQPQDCKDARAFVETWEEIRTAVYYGDVLSPVSLNDYAAKRVARGVKFHVIRDWGYGWSVQDFDGDLRPGDILVFGDQRATARWIAAHLNGKTWDAGICRVESVDDVSMIRPFECDDFCGGFVWDNVNDWGDSFPTVNELMHCI